jgi:hypothetical protein
LTDFEVANSTMLVAPTHPAAALKRDSGAAIFGATNVIRHGTVSTQSGRSYFAVSLRQTNR